VYDIHGNRQALEAVLADAQAAGADQFLFGGDYALFGPFPAETVAILKAVSGATWVRGNVDRWCAHPDDAPDDEFFSGAIAACREALGAELVGELDALQQQVVLDRVRYCHASPISDLRSFLPEPGEDEDELLEGVGERRVVFGHTHLQFRRVRSDGVELINPGSVGIPLDGDRRAAYALAHEDGSVQQCRVAYDHEASAAALGERFGEARWTEVIRRRILTARP
jgi:predicted phosphodiesterase